ncbi:hypothetical protein M8013_20730 [Enterobacteriaceae bacterium H4N4]|uniref:Uncharacterized protein n=1 Tax=Silvania confinis TaxID=2926470 RepID=A0A9J6QSB7_9ENTR|nr:hypothetical protein [Silvania confinis]MCU6671157.1 hypothetical protein [Silvania confinis]
MNIISSVIALPSSVLKLRDCAVALTPIGHNFGLSATAITMGRPMVMAIKKAAIATLSLEDEIKEV